MKTEKDKKVVRETVIVWSDGSKKISKIGKEKIEKKPYTGQQKEVFPEPEDKKIKRIFFIDDFIIILDEEGTVWTKGNYLSSGIGNKDSKKEKILKFSRKETDDENYLDESNKDRNNSGAQNIKIVKIKIGDHHILFLDSEGYVYAMGSNYYGQLGIKDIKVGFTKVPIVVNLTLTIFENKKIKRITPTIQEIKIFHNTSFAIDDKGQLFIWGHGDYLPNFRMNLFTPRPFFQNVIISDVFMSNGRISIVAKPNPELANKKASIGDINNDRIIEDIFLNQKLEIQGEKEKEEIDKDKENIIKKSNNNKIFYEAVKENLNLLVNLFYSTEQLEAKKKNKSLIDPIIFKNTKEREKMIKFIRKSKRITDISENSPDIARICSVLDELQKKRGNRQEVREENEFYWSVFYNLANPTKFFGKGLNDKLNEIKTTIWNLQNNDYEEVEEEGYNFMKQIKNLLENMAGCFQKTIVNAKIENLVYRMDYHQMFLNTYLGTNLREAFEYDLFSSSNHFMKYKLILEKAGEFKKILLKQFDGYLKKMPNFYSDFLEDTKIDSLKQILPCPEKFFYKTNDEEQSEKFVYKNLIESTIFLGDLWKKLLKQVKFQAAIKEKIECWDQDLKDLEELIGIQGYLEKFRFEVVFMDLGEINEQIYQAQRKKIRIEIGQIEGITTRLLLIKENLLTELRNLKEKKDHIKLDGTKANEKEEKDAGKKNLGKIIVLQYLNVLINIAFYKKMTWEILSEYHKRKQKEKIEKNTSQ